MKIENKIIGNTSPVFIIAEAGVNHNGDIDKAFSLVRAAHNAGADAVKFQLFNAKEQISKHAYNAPYQRKGSGKQKMIEMAKSYDLAWERHKEISEYSKKLGIIYMSSCFDKNSVDFFINELGGECVKIGSGEITNYPLLAYLSKIGIQIILSTGMCNMDDIKGALNHINKTGSSEVALMHCVSSYPAPSVDLNLRSIITLKKEFKVLCGFSDHSRGSTAAIAAVALGACIIEKHFTIDNELIGPDHKMSLNPKQLKNFVAKIRDMELSLGDGIKKPTKKEIQMQKYARRSVVANCDIKKGEAFTFKNLTLKRPALGFDARDLDKIIGKKSSKDIVSDSIITKAMVS